MDFFVVFVLCSLATAKVSLQNCFSKKHLITSSDVSFFTAIIFLTAALLFSPNISDTPALVWLFSLIFALFTVLFQLSYTKALAIGNVSLTVMLVNLSMLFPITVSAVFYQEPLHFTRLIGIILTVVSFVLCIELKSKNSISWKWFLLSVFAMLSNAGISITQKVFGSSSFHSEKESFVACSYLLAFFITLIVYGIGKLKKEATTVLKKSSCYLFAILIGVTLAVFQWLNTYAISTIDGTFLFPTYSGGSIILSALVGIFFFKDKLSLRQVYSILIGVFAVILMNF
jgi:drug/metabolite transporter (DMT)-like permease